MEAISRLESENIDLELHILDILNRLPENFTELKKDPTIEFSMVCAAEVYDTTPIFFLEKTTIEKLAKYEMSFDIDSYWLGKESLKIGSKKQKGKINMNEINRRHMQLMLQAIKNYQENQIKYSTLVSRVDELIDNLDNPSKEWLFEAKSLWEDLEIINAILLDEINKDSSIENYRSEIDDLIEKLINLIKNLKN